MQHQDGPKQEREREFHNKAFAEGVRSRAEPFYSVMRGSRAHFESNLLPACSGLRILEYGCGTGTYSFRLARDGARVTGIDISDVAIGMASQRASREGLSIAYQRMDAECLEFPDAAFDVVCGVAILHHLDLQKAYANLARVLKPSGRAVFLEPLGHNPAINLYRHFTPSLRTPDEHPLKMSDLRAATTFFGSVTNRFFTLNSLAAVPFRSTSLFEPIVSALETTDRWLFQACPPLRRYAWQVVTVLRQPIRAASVAR